MEGQQNNSGRRMTLRTGRRSSTGRMTLRSGRSYGAGSSNTSSPTDDQVLEVTGNIGRFEVHLNIPNSGISSANANTNANANANANANPNTNTYTNANAEANQEGLPPLESFPEVRESMEFIRSLAPELMTNAEAAVAAYREGRIDFETAAGTIDHLRAHAVSRTMNRFLRELLSLRREEGNVTSGLKEEVIQQWIKTHKYGAEASTSTQDASCCVCLDHYKTDDDIAKLDCHHEFHFGCIKDWLKVKNKCPLCKRTGLTVPE